MTGGRRQVANALLLLSLTLGVLGMHALVLLPAAPGVGGHVAAPIAAMPDPSTGSAHPMGRPERGRPAFDGVLSQEQVGAIYAYLPGRGVKRIPPGRPKQPAD